jgi:catechol 2,3-dioxygenase-like lactoylglutathione lyase family enzyme
MIRIGSIVLRVDDLQRQTEFWEAALGYVRRDNGESDDFVLLGPADGAGPHLSLDQVRSTLQIPPRIHLDLHTDDQAGEVKRLLALGATEVHWTNDHRTRTTSSSPTLRATASVSWTPARCPAHVGCERG